MESSELMLNGSFHIGSSRQGFLEQLTQKALARSHR